MIHPYLAYQSHFNERRTREEDPLWTRHLETSSQRLSAMAQTAQKKEATYLTAISVAAKSVAA